MGRAEGMALRLLRQSFEPTGQTLRFEWAGKPRQVRLPLIGGFQAENALVAAASPSPTGPTPERSSRRWRRLHTVRGRMQLVATRANGAAVYVDYAHTPEALRTALKALRPHVMGRIVVVFGAGGDRDRGKRPLMGAAAAEGADLAIVTDEQSTLGGAGRDQGCDPLTGMPRRPGPGVRGGGPAPEAILRGVRCAGTRGTRFSSPERGTRRARSSATTCCLSTMPSRPAFRSRPSTGRRVSALWTAEDAARATGGTGPGGWDVRGVSIDTRTLQPGDLFVALQAARDGHDFVAEALGKGAAARARLPRARGRRAGLRRFSLSTTVLDRLARPRERPREKRTRAKVIAITGSVGQDLDEGDVSRCADRSGKDPRRRGEPQQPLGVPLTLARMPETSDFAIVDDRNERSGRRSRRCRNSPSRMWRMVITVAAAHPRGLRRPCRYAPARRRRSSRG